MAIKDLEGDEIRLNHQPLSEIVYDKILDLIFSGTLKVDDKINVDELSRLFKISKTPIREALKSLEKTGLVASTPYAGSYVKRLSVEEIQELYEIRILLETYAIKKIIQNVTSEDISDLEQIQSNIEKRLDSPQIKIYKLNRKFHDRIYSISKMSKLCEMIGQLWDNLCFFRLLLAGNEDYLQTMVAEHHEYIKTIKDRDEAKLTYLTVSNLRRHAERIPDLVEKYYNS